MKVKELIEFLKTQNQDAMVLLSSDEEGNEYEPLEIEYGYASGNFDEEENSSLSIKNSIYHADEKTLKGPYIILYPN